MSTLAGIGFLAGGPVLGAVGAIALGATQSWQVILGALLGQGVAVAVGRVWSEYAAERTTRRALEWVRAGLSAHLSAGVPPAGPSNVVIRATGRTWRDHLITLTVFAAFAVLVGGIVTAVWRTVV